MIEAIDALQVVDVQNHGIANKECVLIYVQKPCNLAEYCLIVTLPSPEGGAVPVKDHMLWFGQGWAFPGDWIFVYTAAGSTTIDPNPKSVQEGSAPTRFISMYWGKSLTIFQNRALSPMLIRIGGTGVMPPPTPAYQGGIGNTMQSRLL